MATRFGLTWWGRRWIAALEALGAPYANRLPRGRTYARRGAVTDLRVAAGEVTALVQGSRARPYRVTLRLPAFGDGTWREIVTALAGELRHAAALLEGQMPAGVDEVLAGCGASLFPRLGELATTCSCPDAANPCKHVAAVHYVLAQAFDSDPFLLPTLRGRDRDRLLAALRAARAGPGEPAGPGGEPAAAAPSSLPAAGLWRSPGDLAGIAVHPGRPTGGAPALRRLGSPPACDIEDAAALERLVAGAAEVAWQLASGGGDTDVPPNFT